MSSTAPYLLLFLVSCEFHSDCEVISEDMECITGICQCKIHNVLIKITQNTYKCMPRKSWYSKAVVWLAAVF